MDDAEQKLLLLGVDSARADWIKSTYITDDTEAIAAKLDERAINANVDYAKRPRASTVSRSTRSPPASSNCSNSPSPSPLPPTPKRARSSPASRLPWKAPTAKASGARQRQGELHGHRRPHQTHGAKAATPSSCATPGPAGTPSRPPMRKDFARYVELANKGARELGFKDNGAMWRSQVRHAARRFRQGTRPPVGAGAPALCLAARLRARQPAREIRRCRARQRPHPRPPAGQHVGPGPGTMSTRWSRRPTPTPATTSPRS